MKKMLSAVALAAAACVATPAGAAITLTFAPSSTHINVGDTVDVTATISGLGAEILSAFDLNFQWNSAIANWTFFSHASGCDNLGPAWGGLSDCAFDSLAQGNVGIIDFSWEDDADIAANQADSFVIATMTLIGVADGVTTLTLGADPDYERNFVGLGASTLQVLVGDACIAVGTGSCNGGNVPEPATFGLAGLALLAAGAAGRRQRRARATA